MNTFKKRWKELNGFSRFCVIVGLPVAAPLCLLVLATLLVCRCISSAVEFITGEEI